MTSTEHLSRIYAVFHAAKALVSMLGPIYLLHLGFDLQAILLYFLVTALIKVPTLYVVFRLAARHGVRLTMSVGAGVMVLHFAWFALGMYDFMWLVVLALLLGVANAFFYSSFRIGFSARTTHAETSRNVARLNNYSTLVMAVAPVIGGFVASLVDIRATYALAAVLFAVATIQIYIYAPKSLPVARFRLREIPRGGAVRDYISNASYSFSGLADLAVWPLFVAILVPTYAGIGLYAGLVVVVAVVAQMIVGRFASVRAEKNILAGGVALNLLYNVGRLFVMSVGQLVGLSFVNGLGGAMLAGAYGSRFYKNIHAKKHLEYLFAMEIANSVTWLVYFPILLLLSTLLSYEDTLRAGVILVAPAVLGMLLMRVFAVGGSAKSA